MKNTVILMIISSLFLYGCPDYGADDNFPEEKILHIINNSNDTVMFDVIEYDYKDESDLIDEFIDYPLTADVEYRIIYPKSEKTNFAVNVFDTCNCSETYFIYTYNTIKNVPWDSIVLDSMYLKRWDFHSWEEYENIDFTLTYP